MLPVVGALHSLYKTSKGLSRSFFGLPPDMLPVVGALHSLYQNSEGLWLTSRHAACGEQ